MADYDAVRVAELENRLAEHRRRCNRCFQGIYCPAKQQLQIDINLARNQWKEDRKSTLPAGERALAAEIDQIVGALQHSEDGDPVVWNGLVSEQVQHQDVQKGHPIYITDPIRFPNSSAFMAGDPDILPTDLVWILEPACPHGLPVWDCVTCSARGCGGSDWRTCSHGYPKGECPACDKEAS